MEARRRLRLQLAIFVDTIDLQIAVGIPALHLAVQTAVAKLLQDGLLAVFNGEMSGGKAEGFGTLRFRNDESGGFNTYLGTFEGNKPYGEGIFESSEGWQFDAFFEGSFDTGDGTLIVFAEEDAGAHGLELPRPASSLNGSRD